MPCVSISGIKFLLKIDNDFKYNIRIRIGKKHDFIRFKYS